MKFRITLLTISHDEIEFESPAGCDSHPHHFRVLRHDSDTEHALLGIVWCVTPPPIVLPPREKPTRKRGKPKP